MFTIAHVKWFVESSPHYTPKFSLIEWLITLLLVIVGLMVLFFINQRYHKNSINRWLNKMLGQFEWVVPVAVRWTTGFLLILNFLKHLLYAPNVPVGPDVLPHIISALFLIIGVCLLLGLYPRLSSLTLIGLYIASLCIVHPTPDVLDHIEYIGIGAYLLIRGGGDFCVYKYEPYLRFQSLKPYSKDLLRIFVGFDLMVLAVTEKLQGVGYSTEFLEHYHWNFLHAVGIHDRAFILIAGVIEFVVGLSLVFNWAPRVTTAIVLGLMVITASLLGLPEVYGHLFAVSLVAVVWLNDEEHYRKLTKRKVRRKSRSTGA